MRKPLVGLAVGMPLALSTVLIVAGLVSNSFPIFSSFFPDETDIFQQTYRAGLDYCENSYDDAGALNKKIEYEECVNAVEMWYRQNQE